MQTDFFHIRHKMPSGVVIEAGMRSGASRAALIEQADAIRDQGYARSENREMMGLAGEFDPRYKHAADYELWLRFWRRWVGLF